MGTNRGIVLLAGGPTYFLNAYVNARLLHGALKSILPIEWFYLGAEMRPEWIRKIKETLPKVSLIDLGGSAKKNIKQRGGWQNKVNAILASSFNDVLFLDADCFPYHDPSYLFDHEFYKSTGCVLFPDPFEWTDDKIKYLNKKYGVSLPKRQVESGQMMFDKSKCMEGLLKTKVLNDNSEDVYKDVYGDKDTFLIGMLQAQSPFRVAPFQCDGALPQGMIHKDFDGKPVFLHLAPGKLMPGGVPPIRKQFYPLRAEMYKIMQELKTEGLF